LIHVTTLGIIQFLAFITGLILIIYAGKQDKNTRTPILLIPALIAIGISAGAETFSIITIISTLIFFSPSKINKLIGKADLLLFASTLIIIILNQNKLLTLSIYISLALTIGLILFDKNKTNEIPVIHYFSKGYILATIAMIPITIAATMGGVI